MSDVLITAFLNFAGPVTLVAFFLWAHSVYQLVREEFSVRKGQWAVSAGLALAGTAVAFLSTEVGFKVLSDETNLLSVANMLALFGKASNTQMWTYYYHNFHALDVSVPSRPILFPVLTALVHLAVGFRSWSPFVVNFFGLFGLLFLAVEWGRKALGGWRVIALLAMMMSPVLMIVSTSAGYDLCSLFFGFAAFLSWRRFDDGRREDALRVCFLSLVCFASVRYETIVALPLAALGLWRMDRKRPFPLDLYSTVALLVIPLFVQRVLTWGSFENPPGVPAFSPLHMARHFPIFVEAFFLDGKGAYPVLLHWLGLGGLVLVLKNLRKSHLVVLAYTGFLLAILLCHHFGLADHPTQVRLFLPLSFALSLLALHFLGWVGGKADRVAVTGVFALLCFHHHQYSLQDPLTATLTMTREMRHIREFLEEDGTINDLNVYERPGQIAALGRSALGTQFFLSNKASYITNLRNKLYQRILLIEKVRYNGPPDEAPLIREGYRLTPLKEYQLSGEERLRISRLEWF